MVTKNYSLPQWSDGEEFKVIAQLNPRLRHHRH
jgi:hypothetical protein